MQYFSTGRFKSWNGNLELEYISHNHCALLTQQQCINFNNVIQSDAIKILDSLHHINGDTGRVANDFLIRHKLKQVSIRDVFTGVGVIIKTEDYE